MGGTMSIVADAMRTGDQFQGTAGAFTRNDNPRKLFLDIAPPIAGIGDACASADASPAGRRLWGPVRGPPEEWTICRSAEVVGGRRNPRPLYLRCYRKGGGGDSGAGTCAVAVFHKAFIPDVSPDEFLRDNMQMLLEAAPRRGGGTRGQRMGTPPDLLVRRIAGELPPAARSAYDEVQRVAGGGNVAVSTASGRMPLPMGRSAGGRVPPVPFACAAAVVVIGAAVHKVFVMLQGAEAEGGGGSLRDAEFAALARVLEYASVLQRELQFVRSHNLIAGVGGMGACRPLAELLMQCAPLPPFTEGRGDQRPVEGLVFPAW